MPCGSVVLGELKSFHPEHEAAYGEINAALKSVAAKLPRTALVPSDDLAHRGDKLHFDKPSLRILGLRYADAMMRLQGNTGK